MSVGNALYKYDASVKNAKESIQTLNEEIEMINDLARSHPTRSSLCKRWIAEQSPAIRYKVKLDGVIKELPEDRDSRLVMSATMSRKRLEWSLTEFQGCDQFRYFTSVNQSKQQHVATEQLKDIEGLDGRPELHHQKREYSQPKTRQYLMSIAVTMLFDLEKYSNWYSGCTWELVKISGHLVVTAGNGPKHDSAARQLWSTKFRALSSAWALKFGRLNYLLPVPPSAHNFSRSSMPFQDDLSTRILSGTQRVLVGRLYAAEPVQPRLYQYGVSVKNAEKSLQKLTEEITMINNIASNAEEFVRKLDKRTTPTDFCQHWIAEQSPAMRYKKALDELMKTLSHNHGRSSGMKVLKQLTWPLIEPEIKRAIESFERWIPCLQLSLSFINTDTLSEMSKQAAQHHATLLKCAADVSTKIERQHKDFKRRVLDWMDAVNCTNKYESTLGQRQANTCQWLFDLDKYSDWYSSRDALLWVHGKPGAGKSVLISAVIERLSKTVTDGGVLAYFYCDFRTDRSTHAFEVIRSLTTQLLRQSRENWLPAFKDLVARKSNGSPPPVDLEMLYNFLLNTLRLHHDANDRPVLVIDALDECKDYVKLVELFERLHKEGYCRLFTTSRRLPDAPKAFKGLPTIDLYDMRAETLCDMQLHVNKEVAMHDKLMPFRDKVVPSLLKKADGMFRWVQLQLDRLTRCRTQGDIRTVLDTLPSGLYETYDRILTEVNGNEFDGRIVKSALLWLVGSLTKLGLRWARRGSDIRLRKLGLIQWGQASFPVTRPRCLR
ncbi:hypothetical protein BU15DRAFT_66308 [Melanogaster broomeanus]|nr:hypothetical protein BU15DRAFT_66308 [Melanogaster broomeanus]